MATIDRLDIQIEGSAQKANAAINDIIKNLDRLANSLKIDTSGLEKIGKSLNFSRIDKAAKNMQSQTQKVSKSLSQITEQYKDLGKGFEIKGSTQQIQKQIDTLTNKLANAKLAKDDFEASGKTNLGGYETAVKNVIKYTNQIESLKKQLAGLHTAQPKLDFNVTGAENSTKFLIEYKKELMDFKNDMKSIGDVYGGLQNVPKGFLDTPIQNLKQSIEELKQSYPQATNVISAFEKELHRLQEVSSKLTKEPIKPKIETGQVDEKVKEAIQKTDSLGNRVESLKAKLKELSGQGLNFGDTKFDETYKKLNQANKELEKHKKNLEETGNSGKTFSEKLRNALASINSQTSKTGSGFGGMASYIKNAFSGIFNLLIRTSSLSSILTGNVKKLSSSMAGFSGYANKAATNLKSFTRQALSAMGIYLGVYGVVRGLKNAIKSSMDYVENLNYFNAAFGQVAEKADLKSFKKMGYDSAEAYYNSFAQRAEQLTQKMSGFKIDESGMALSIGKKSMGIDPNLVMNYQAMFAQMTSSMGTTSEMSMKLSDTLTRLGADLASVKNIGFKNVWENMASGITGMSRTLDKYGTNIRNTNLQQELSNIGIDKSISKLNQQEKALLRTIIMLDSTRYAWGDMAKTIERPANQLRLLQSNFSNLGRTIGNIFLPIVAKVLPYINAVTIMLQRFAEQIVKFLGFKDFDWGGLGGIGSSNLDLGNLPDDSEDVADNMDKTAKKAKKAVDNLQGFDIVNKLQDPNADKDSGSEDKGKGLSGAEMAKLTGALGKLMDEYNKAWENAFKDMKNKANELANKMQKALVNAWNKGDFSELGKKAAGWINRGIAKIPWESIKKTVKKTAHSIATFLNGYIEELDWGLVGKTFAEGLNTVIEGGYEFWTTFDWLTFGTSLATGVNSFIQNFDAEKFGKLLGAKLRGMIQFAFGFVTNLDFEEIGTKMGDAINGFFEDMGEVRQNTGLTGWQELGKTISKSVTGILDTINTALSAVKWEEVGKAIGQFIGSINWGEIFVKAGTVIVNALWSAVKVAMSAIAEDPVGIAEAAISIFGAVFAYKKLSALISPLKGNIGLILSTAIRESKIGKAVSSLGSVFVGTLKNTIMSSGITQTIISLFSRVTGKISAVGTMIGTKLMNGAKAVLSNPTTGLVAIAAAAAVGAGLIIADRLKEAIDAVNFTGDYEMKIPEGFTKAAEEAKKALGNTLKGAEETKKTIDGINKSVQTTDGKNIDEMANKYFKLSQKAKPTASDIAVMKKYSSELSDAIPGFAKNVDKQTGAFKGSREELDSLVSSTQRAARAQAAYNASVELYEKQQENKKSIEEKEKVLSNYEKEYEEIKKVTEAVKQQHGVESEIYKAQLRSQGTFASKVNSARAEVDALKKSQKDISSQIKKNNKIMDNAKVSTENYAKANKTLKDKMKELNVSSQSQKDVIKKLNSLVDEGEISWKDYKKIVDGNYTSVDELNIAIGRLSPKSVEVKATTSGKEDVSNLKGTVDEIKNKSVTITANAETKNANEKIKNLTTGKNITITANAKIDEEKLKSVKERFKKLLGINAIKVPIQYAITESQKKILDKFKPGGNNPVYAKALKDSGLGKLNEAMEKLPVIKGYAIGGFPDSGQLFIANEAGPELVGKMNGRTAVAPQNDIAEGFAVAITNTLAPVMYSAFKQAAIETAQISGGDVYLDGMKVTDNIIGHINQISKSRGRSPIWGVN